MRIGIRTEEVWPYVLGQPETIPIRLRVLKVELFVHLEIQFFAHAGMLFIEGITDLVRNYIRGRL